MKNLTLAIEEEVLEEARVLAAENQTTVNAMVRAFLRQAAARRALAGPSSRSFTPEASGAALGSEALSAEVTRETSHQKMQRLLEEGRARYANRQGFDREYTHDRDYQRAESYFDNRAYLLKLIDESTADMGRQKWNREALYDR